MLPKGIQCAKLEWMKCYNWSPEKNETLKRDRGISFEMAVWWLESGGLVDIMEHPNKKRYPSQKIYVVRIEEYVHWVPFVESENEIFLKTVIPSRKATRQHVEGQK